MTKMGDAPAVVVAAEQQQPTDQQGSTSPRRFVVAAAVGVLAVAGPYLWVLSTLWGHTNFFRKTAFEDNFYDLQARAIFHGHLFLAKGSIGIEGFIHGGREYTYFGLFPSIIRMPILLFTSAADGKLTPLSILTSWIVTAVFAALLLWRIRVVIRGSAALGWAEAVSYGALTASIVGGSVLVYLAATPYVFDDDLAWSVALTIASLFALLGVIEKPTTKRMVGAGFLVLAANMDRTTTGWACVLAAVLIALWFKTGRGGNENRDAFVPMLLVGLLPFAAGCSVNWLKFGTPIGLPITDQVWSHLNAHRELFLRKNHNSEVGTAFAPADALAYLRPDGLRFSSVFPFVELPGLPARSLFGVIFDRRYRTASVPASMPLLFVLSIWGTIAAFRRQPRGGAALTRILVFAAAVAGGALLLWGYIANRYLADFVPFLAVAGMVGIVDLWRRIDGRARPTRRPRRVVCLVIVLGALASIFINFGIALTPTSEWSIVQAAHYVKVQKEISDVTGGAISSNVHTGTSLPEIAPADELFVVGDCSGLYISTGEDVSSVPSQEYQRGTWLAVQRGSEFEHTFEITFPAAPNEAATTPLVVAGKSSVVVTTSKLKVAGFVSVTYHLRDPLYPTPSLTVYLATGTTHSVEVITDSANHTAEVFMDGGLILSGPMTGGAAGVVPAAATATTTGPATTTVVDTTSTAVPPLCRSLLAQR